MSRRYLPHVVVGLFFVGTALVGPTEAAAQGFIAPFIGFDYGGDSGCQTAAGCKDKRSNLGVAVGKMGAALGGELEFGYARNFFGEAPGQSSNVLTLMTNLMIVPRIGVVHPYLLGGFGLIKTHAELTTGSLLETDNNSFGWDLGGGVIVLFGGHVGVRGDIRRFSSFQERTILGFSLSNEKLSFQRASVGLVLAF
jgi:opacity protein-like surface antigen